MSKECMGRHKNRKKLKLIDCPGRRVVDGVVEKCGINFMPASGRQKFHSPACQKRTRYLRDRAKNTAAAQKWRAAIYADPEKHKQWLEQRKAHKKTIPDKVAAWAHAHYVRRGKDREKARRAAEQAKLAKLAKIEAGGAAEQKRDIHDRGYFAIGRRVENARLMFQRVYAALPRQKDRTRASLKAQGFVLTPDQIDVVLTSKNELVAARQFIASVTGLEYQTVAAYHKQYLRELQPSLPLSFREAS